MEIFRWLQQLYHRAVMEVIKTDYAVLIFNEVSAIDLLKHCLFVDLMEVCSIPEIHW